MNYKEELSNLLSSRTNLEAQQIASMLEVPQAIDRLPDERLARLLRLRYIDGMTWERVAVEMHYSYMQVCRMHGKALDVIECYTRTEL